MSMVTSWIKLETISPISTGTPCLDRPHSQIVTFTGLATAEKMIAKQYLRTPEQRLIAAIKDWTGDSSIGDDCAELPGQTLVTVDTLVEGTHFLRPLISLRDLGWKAIAVNLSDIAAMAGRPRYLLVSLTLPESLKTAEFRQLYQGMLECARAHRVRIAGGDLTRGPIMVISVTVLGEAHENGCLRRSGARPGDVVAVTGDFGASAAGLWALTTGIDGFTALKQRHCRPVPRLTEGWLLASEAGSRGALMDASDGLADALVQISAASGTGVEVDLELVPVAMETLRAAQSAGVCPLDWAMYGGEDYELVACLPGSTWDRLGGLSKNPFTAIGEVTASGTITLKNYGASGPGIDLARGFQHWRNLL